MTDGGRSLGVDLGRARVGLALSDPLGLVAQPLVVLEQASGRRQVEAVARAIDEHEVTTVVVGLPRLLSGAEGQAATDARAFVERLTRLRPNVRIELWDERLTTRQAERAMIEADARRSVRKAKIDAVAAALILQGWLDARAAPG